MLLLAKSLFVRSDGACYVQLVEGIQKSGSFITPPGESRMRDTLSKLYAYCVEGADKLDWPVAAMGGDSVERTFENPEGFSAWLKQYGLKPSAGDYAVVPAAEVEFRSRRIKGDDGHPGAELLSIGQCMSKFLYGRDKTPEAVAWIRYAARHSPEINKLESYWYQFRYTIWKQSFFRSSGSGRVLTASLMCG